VESTGTKDQLYAVPSFCEIRTVGQPVFQMMNAQPVKEEIGVTLSYWMAKYRAERVPDELRTKFTINRCGSSDDDGGQIDLQQMASVLIIFALSAALAFAIWIVEFLLKKKHFEQRALERQASKADKPKKTRWRKERLRHGTSSYKCPPPGPHSNPISHSRVHTPPSRL